MFTCLTYLDFLDVLDALIGFVASLIYFGGKCVFVWVQGHVLEHFVVVNAGLSLLMGG